MQTVSTFRPISRISAPRFGAVKDSLKDNPFLLSMMLLVIFSIGRAHSILGPLKAMRPTLLLVLIAITIAFTKPNLLELSNLKRAWTAKLLVVLAGVACCSVLFGISVGNAGTFFIDSYWKTLLFAFFLIIAQRSARDLFRIMWAFAIAIAFLAYMSNFVFGISKNQGAYGYDSNDVGLLMVTGFPIALYCLQASRGKMKWVAFGIVVMSAMTVAISQSRGSFVAFVMVGLGLMLFVRSIGFFKKLLFVGVAAGALAASAPPGYWDLIMTLKDPQEDYNWSAENGRKQLVVRGIGYMLQYPVFGIGIANFPRAEGLISDKARNAAAGSGVRWAAAHNSYVQISAELGIPGMLIWFSLLFGGAFQCVRVGRRMPKAWANGDPEQRYLYYAGQYIPVALLGFAVNSFFVSFAYLEPFYALVAIQTGFLLFAKKKFAEAAGARTQMRRAPGVVGSRGPVGAFAPRPAARAIGWQGA
jgi:O-antigen ligase